MNRFEAGTKNAEIFKTTAPYNNYSQGSAPRWLFVCSAGLLRSPTGEDTYVLCEKCGYAANVEAMKTVIDTPASRDGEGG